MNAVRKAVLEALSDAPQGRKDIADEARLEPQQVSMALLAMSRVGLAKRTPEGWIKGDGVATSAPEPQPERAAPEPVDVPVFTQKRKSTAAPLETARRKHQLAAPGVATAPPEKRIDFTRFGDFIVVKRTDFAELIEFVKRWHDVLVAS